MLVGKKITNKLMSITSDSIEGEIADMVCISDDRTQTAVITALSNNNQPYVQMVVRSNQNVVDLKVQHDTRLPPGYLRSPTC